jgi:hypothetical protein
MESWTYVMQHALSVLVTCNTLCTQIKQTCRRTVLDGASFISSTGIQSDEAQPYVSRGQICIPFPTEIYPVTDSQQRRGPPLKAFSAILCVLGLDRVAADANL